jgi:short-subunit dehydrogenase
MRDQSSVFTLITGANSGIGLELARQAAADGRNLILVGRNERTLESAAEELRRSVTVHTIVEDLSEPGAAHRVFDRVGALGVDVDCLINNAGFGDYGPFSESDLAKQESMIGVNITALTALTRLFLPAMLERGRGHILNMASVAGFMPGPLMSVYFATKHYVLAFSEALVEELRGTGVKVTVLCPPPVRTSFSNAARLRRPATCRPRKRHPPKWPGTVTE